MRRVALRTRCHRFPIGEHCAHMRCSLPCSHIDRPPCSTHNCLRLPHWHRRGTCCLPPHGTHAFCHQPQPVRAHAGCMCGLSGTGTMLIAPDPARTHTWEQLRRNYSNTYLRCHAKTENRSTVSAHKTENRSTASAHRFKDYVRPD